MRERNEERDRQNAELVLQAQAGSEEARNELITLNTNMIHYMANRHKGKSWKFSYDDLFQEGVLGVIDAIETFDAAAGTFGVWLFKTVNGRMLNSMRPKKINVGEVSTQSAIADEDGNEVTIEDRLTYETVTVVEFGLGCDVAAIQSAMERALTADEQFAVVLKFGLDGEGPRQLEDLWSELQKRGWPHTKMMAHYLVDRAITKLRAELEL